MAHRTFAALLAAALPLAAAAAQSGAPAAAGCAAAQKIVTGVATSTDTVGVTAASATDRTISPGGPVTITPGRQAQTAAASAGPGTTPAAIAIDEEGGPNQHADRPKPKGTPATGPATGTTTITAPAAQARHAIKTKGTGASGRCDPPAEGALMKKSKSNTSTN